MLSTIAHPNITESEKDTEQALAKIVKNFIMKGLSQIATGFVHLRQ